MKKLLLTCAASAALLLGHAQTAPVITSWIINLDGTNAQFYTDANTLTDLGEEANVQRLCYDANFIYAETEGLAEIMGPCGNPGNPTAQGKTWKIPRNPTENTGTKTESPDVASLGVLINGVPIYALSDGRSYRSSSGTNEGMGDNIWWGEAYYTEGFTLDDKYGGHPQQQGEYHSHAVPTALYGDTPTSQHSPLVGWSWDGYPVYGPYGYSDANDANSSVKLMESSYSLRSITQRQSLPDGSALQPSEYGPDVNNQFPLGSYIQDYEYIANQGDLDEHNGRFSKTPEFPDGIYAYFVTVEANGTPVFPYYIGTTYYGVVEESNIGVSGGTAATPGGVDCYEPLAVATVTEEATLNIYPNPSAGMITLSELNKRFRTVDVLDLAGRVVHTSALNDQGNAQQIDLSGLPAGSYVVRLSGDGQLENKIIVLN